MKEEIKLEESENEREKALVPPYFVIKYIDDSGAIHLAEIKDTLYLQFLKDRYGLIECRKVEVQAEMQ